jgi:hypothetical protein
MQKADPFVLQYMSGIGHHEFGLDLRPIDFQGWLSSAEAPGGLSFWLQYWTAAYRAVLQTPTESYLFAFDDLAGSPEDVLPRLADAVDVPADLLLSQADRIALPPEHPVDVGSLPTSLVEGALETWTELRSQAE